MFNGTLVGQPEAFLGIAPRFSDLSAPNADNIIDAGGTGANLTSSLPHRVGARQSLGNFPERF